MSFGSRFPHNTPRPRRLFHRRLKESLLAPKPFVGSLSPASCECGLETIRTKCSEIQARRIVQNTFGD